MCLAIPVQIKTLNNPFAEVEWNGVNQRISTILLEDVRVGDYVLIHAGCAIQKLNEDDARERLELIRELYEISE